MGLHHHHWFMTLTSKDVNSTQHKPIFLSLYTPNKTKQNKKRKEDHYTTATTTTTTKSFKTMRVKATLINFKSKLSKSCNRFVSLFRFRVKRSLFIRPLRRARHGNVKPRHHHHHPKKPISFSSSSLLSCLCFLSTNKDQNMRQTKPRSSSCKKIYQFSFG